jgi:putative hydrolase of the HAD superfamily
LPAEVNVEGIKNSIHAVLFDFGGVLAEEGFRLGLQSLARQQGLDIAAIHGEGTRAMYDSGFILGRGSAADFWTLMRQRTGLIGDDALLTQTILSGLVLRPAMIDLVRQLRAMGCVTGILSDQTHWLDTLNEQNPFYSAFDRIYNSYYLGKGKQDLTVFADVAADLKLPPADILFVDDDAGNVQRAREAGMQAILYSDQPGLMAEMEKLGIVFNDLERN